MRHRDVTVRRVPPTVSLTSEDKAELLAYWQFYEPLAPPIQDELRRAAAEMPAWGPVIRAMTASQIADSDRRSMALHPFPPIP